MARHLDLMHYYNALIQAAEDREKYVETLVGILNKIRTITGTKTNQELVEMVERLIAENGIK